MLRTLLAILLAFLVALVATYAAVLFGTLLAWDLLGIRDHDGGGAMNLAFLIAPAVSLFVSVIVAFVVGARVSSAGPAAKSPMSSGRRRAWIGAGAVIGAACAYLLASLALWIVHPPSVAIYVVAVALNWSPLLAAAIGGYLGGLATARLSGPAAN